MKILIVDDSSTMRKIVSNVVLQTGIIAADIYTAEDGVQALKILESPDYKIDIVLTDWNMPKMNGLELVLKLREHPIYKKIPILMITTEGGKEEVIKALKAGVNNYIVKPFGADVLKEKLAPFLRRKNDPQFL